MRLVFRVASVTLDDAGNARSADVRVLDAIGRNPIWRRWKVGMTLHWRPFKITLLHTKRAGLHVSASWRDDNRELRYGGNFKIRDRGVFVLNPSNVVCIAEPLIEAIGCKPEADLIDDNLRLRFGWDAHGLGRPCQYLYMVQEISEEKEAELARNEAA
jgi:hypothetical protein